MQIPHAWHSGFKAPVDMSVNIEVVRSKTAVVKKRMNSFLDFSCM